MAKNNADLDSTYHALRKLPQLPEKFKSGDVLVLFGELFNRGYANGLVEEAEKRGMKIVRSTVGRRDKDGTLRALNEEETANIPKPFINVPLEAGFDLESDDSGKPILDFIKDTKLSEWENAAIPEKSLQEAKNKGRARFKKNLTQYLSILEKEIPAGKNILFAHLMAGGVPRTKIIMPLMNRSVKGTGERFLSSEKFWKSPLGHLCEVSFNEVTAETFNTLVTETADLRKKWEASNAHVSYLAYGYHGTEVLVNGEYQWQSYSPYVQGWAKKKLEDYSRQFFKQGLHTCVYNCPEILTNSSAIFSGVELALYTLLGALKKEGANSKAAQKMISDRLAELKDGHSVESIMKFTGDYISSDIIQEHCQYPQWPQHNSKEQLEKMLKASDELIEMHKDPKQLMTFALSEVVFEACGQAMLADSYQPEAPVSWINHDIIAKLYSEKT